MARAIASGGKARLGIDHVVFDLLHRDDLPVQSAEPELTRLLDAEGSAQMHTAAARCADVLLRPLGGEWHPAELLYDPEDAGMNPSIDAFIRTVLGLNDVSSGDQVSPAEVP
jgi:hypothetical protein